MPAVAYGLIDTVFGPAFAAVDNEGALVRFIISPDRELKRAAEAGLKRDDAALAAAAEQVDAYGRGERFAFELPLSTRGDSFQEAVWAALRAIPMGHTRTYGEIAEAVGDKGAARAVGQACNANPLMLITPCHRVIGADGRLTGFGGGLPLKARMLEFERKLAGPQRELF